MLTISDGYSVMTNVIGCINFILTIVMISKECPSAYAQKIKLYYVFMNICIPL